MQLIRYLNSTRPALKDGVLTIGNFDGVHLGHQKVIGRVKQLSADLSCPSLVMLFEPTPKEFFMRENAPARLMTWRDRYVKLRALGIDGLIQCRFNQDLANMDAHEFIERILVKQLSIRHLVIGDDFHFGKNRIGNFALLKDAGKTFGFLVEDTQTLHSVSAAGAQRVSSTAIRDALQAGEFSRAENFLGEPYSMSGRVIHGQKLGRTLGFPTLNIKVSRQVSPLHGVYVVKVHGLGNEVKPAIASIGTRPVVAGKEWLLEVHLIDFAGDCYGKRLKVEFCSFVRTEQNFSDLEKLQAQMKIDLNQARTYFRTENS